jgi:DNA-binding winged helix-turn-helix (wHTH) protein
VTFDLLRFGPFDADLRTGELRKRGIRIKLARQSFQVMAALAGRAGELVTRDELQRILWPNETIVEFDHSINTAVKRIREALSDSADQPRYLETLPRRGYRFVAEVERISRSQPAPVGPRRPFQQHPKWSGAIHWAKLSLIIASSKSSARAAWVSSIAPKTSVWAAR